jgi:hypothetical protein
MLYESGKNPEKQGKNVESAPTATHNVTQWLAAMPPTVPGNIAVAIRAMLAPSNPG